MKTYFKALFLLLLVFSCSPEEIDIKVTLTTQVKPANSGTIARLTTGNSDNVLLKALPTSNYVFKGWYYEDKSTKLDIRNPIYILLDADKVVTAVFEKKDTDGDGVADDIDDCLDTPSGEVVDEYGCSESQLDGDNDGIMNDIDNCLQTANANQLDFDQDGIGDVCDDDIDGDGIMNNADLCANTPSGEEVDSYGCSDYQKAPTAPTLKPSNVTTTSVDLSWTASTDNFGVIEYDILIDGVVVQTVTGTTASITELTPLTTYSFTVIARDASDNVSAASNTVIVTSITVTIRTDAYSEETHWDIKNELGTIIASGGPIYEPIEYTTDDGDTNDYPIFDSDQWVQIDGEIYDESSTINIIVPLVNGNFTFTIYDYYHDGIFTYDGNDIVNGGYDLKDVYETIFATGGGGDGPFDDDFDNNEDGFYISESVVFSVSDSGAINVITLTSNKPATKIKNNSQNKNKPKKRPKG